MSLKHRLQRLEQVERERLHLREAERIAQKYGLDVDQLLREEQELGERIARWGVDAEVRRMAEEFGVSEDEMRARWEAALLEEAGET